ncbi:nucleotidyltransferase family protein [Hansschlegelia zhihuaiae]|uniref:Nucleotidyltransferase domain-containing protein n=1 Tax=Hansschlegelia zhihuaiae TaxID=405005 RepID=A0A4Q0MKR0_9HYPH|nr:nucleotidyltransferase domain-containing protein [Hansschlegelia zhihuaiae]RXF74367.1 nucleotidyltransferase domain-containing protein [Hansschlegelia zhihuaiae]
MSMSREDLLQSLLDLEPSLRAEGVTHMALFGSRARRDNRPDSDIDVAIDVEPNARFSLLDLIGVVHCIEDKTALSADVFMRRSLSEGLRKTLSRDAIEVF